MLLEGPFLEKLSSLERILAGLDKEVKLQYMKTELIEEWQINCTAEKGQVKLPAEEYIDRLVYPEKQKDFEELIGH